MGKILPVLPAKWPHSHVRAQHRIPLSSLIPPVERALTNDAEVIIGDNVWIGDNVVILPGVHIGDGSIIGANAVVTHDIPPNSIAVGSPARVIKQWNARTQTWDNVTRK